MTYTVKLKGGGRVRTDGMLMYHHLYTHQYFCDTITGITLQDEGKEIYIPIDRIKEVHDDEGLLWRRGMAV